MVKCIRYSLLVGSFALMLTGLLTGVYNIMLTSILVLFIHNLFFSAEHIQNRIIFLFFNITAFVFLICRPVIDMFRGDIWYTFTHEAVVFTMLVLFLTLLFLFLGAMLAEEVLKRREKRPPPVRRHSLDGQYGDSYRSNLQIVSLILFYFTMACFLLVEFDKMSFMNGKEYVEFFTEYQTRLPSVIGIFADMMPFFLCIYLSTMPKKSMAFLPLCLYVFSALPSLKIGLRNPIVLNAIFVFLYYFLRDVAENSKKWIGRIEKALLVILTPIAVVFLGAYNYIREGAQTVSGGLFDTIVDFFYRQGVSYNVLNIAYEKLPVIQSYGSKNYTFGDFIEYFQHGSLAQMLFGATSLGSGNNVVRATQGNSFAHAMSYAALGDEYLKGHGYGSSYVLETYVDFGYVGMALFSLLLGFLLVYLVYWFRKKNWVSALVLISLTELFLVPRASALSWVDFVITIPFLFAVLFSHFAAGLCLKSYSPLAGSRWRRRPARQLRQE